MEFLLGGDDDLLTILEETTEVARLLGVAHHGLEVGELLDILTDVLVEGLPVGE